MWRVLAQQIGHPTWKIIFLRNPHNRLKNSQEKGVAENKTFTIAVEHFGPKG